jgi:ankyrin repeat protein
MSAIRSIITVLILLFSISSCGQNKISPEEARMILAKMNIQYNESSFLNSIKNNDIVAVNLFLIAGINQNAYEKSSGKFAITIAYDNKFNEIVRLLINKKATLNEQNQDGQTFLMLYSISGNDDMVDMLIQNEANINIQDIEGETALSYALLKNHKNIANQLIINGADINIKNIYGISILHNSISKADIDLIKFIIEKGADINTVHYTNVNALYVAIICRKLDIAQLLIDRGANLTNNLIKSDIFSWDWRDQDDYNKIRQFFKRNGVDEFPIWGQKKIRTTSISNCNNNQLSRIYDIAREFNIYNLKNKLVIIGVSQTENQYQ